ncbi:hypothetical protein DNG35_00580 [Mesonia sp. K7]|nr:hypothetical protein DNG35_00580 [Mesonia sp. K7]
MLLILLTIAPSHSKAQTTDLVRLEYTRIPYTEGRQSVNRFRGFLQGPIPLWNDNFLVIGLDYRKFDIDFDDTFPFSTENLKELHNIQASLGYVFKPKPESDWRLAVNTGVRIASNLQGKPISDDYIYSISAYAILDKKGDDATVKPYRLIIGALYSTTPGRNYPLPFINYFREFHPQWTYTVGVPKMALRYKFNATNHVQAYAMLDNFFANIQEDFAVEGSKNIAQNISATQIILGFGYEHYFTDHIVFYAYGGHTVYNEYRLRDNDREDVYVIENDNTFYIRSGIKFKL